MGVRLCLQAPAAGVDLMEDPPPSLDVPSGDFVFQDGRTATLLVFGLKSYNFGAKILPEPTIHGHGLDHLHQIVARDICEDLLQSGRVLKIESLQQKPLTKSPTLSSRKFSTRNNVPCPSR